MWCGHAVVCGIGTHDVGTRTHAPPSHARSIRALCTVSPPLASKREHTASVVSSPHRRQAATDCAVSSARTPRQAWLACRTSRTGTSHMRVAGARRGASLFASAHASSRWAATIDTLLLPSTASLTTHTNSPNPMRAGDVYEVRCSTQHRGCGACGASCCTRS